MAADDIIEMTGILHRWATGRGFGFIAPSDGTKDIWVHMKSLVHGAGSVREGGVVKFRRLSNDKKVSITPPECTGPDQPEEKEPSARSRSRSRGTSGSVKAEFHGGWQVEARSLHSLHALSTDEEETMHVWSDGPRILVQRGGADPDYGAQGQLDDGLSTVVAKLGHVRVGGHLMPSAVGHRQRKRRFELRSAALPTRRRDWIGQRT